MKKLHLETVQRGVLQDIGNIQPVSDADYEVLRDLGDILRKHKCTDRFGVCLLHKHFDIADDEELVEKVDTQERMAVTSVQKISKHTEGTIETMWRFCDDMQTITKCVVRCKYIFGHPRVHVKEGY